GYEDGVVHAADLEVGARQVGEEWWQEDGAGHGGGSFEARHAAGYLAALEERDAELRSGGQRVGVEVHGLRQLVLGGLAVAQAERYVAEVVMGGGAGGV